MDQHVASLEHDARQPRYAMVADGPANTKTREHTEGAANAVQAVHGSCSATRVEPGPKTNSTSFGMMTEPPDLPCRDDVLVENDAASLKSCLPSLEMRTTIAAGGLLPPGKASTAECFDDWEGRGYDDFVPGEVTKTTPSGDRTTRSPTWSASLPRLQLIAPGGWSNKSPGGALFRAVPSQNGEIFVHLLPPPKVERLSNQDHLQQLTSSALRSRGDEIKGEKCMDFNSIRLVRQQLLEPTCRPLPPESH